MIRLRLATAIRSSSNLFSGLPTALSPALMTASVALVAAPAGWPGAMVSGRTSARGNALHLGPRGGTGCSSHR